MSDADLQHLHAELGVLDTALDAGDLAAADRHMAAYDSALRRYLQQRGNAAPVAALRELLRMQNELLARMHDDQERVGGELRRVWKAGAASRAYAGTGTDR